MYLVIPALFIAAMNYFAVEVPVDEDDKQTTKTDDQFSELFGEDTGPQKVAPLPLVLSFWAYLGILIVYTRLQRQSTRREIMKKLYEERAAERGDQVDSNRLNLFLGKNRGDMIAAHRSCCCYGTDDIFFSDDGVASLANVQTNQQEIEEDFCTSLWKCLSNTFWASCCACWCQCCSICAVWQEEMEVNRLTENEEHTFDYVTFQVSLTEFHLAFCLLVSRM
jgi:hypothetical protein